MKNLIHLSRCLSTNDEVECFADGFYPEGFAVYTLNQTNGRGQYGNSWISPPDETLALSFCTPKAAVSIAPILFNFHTANVVREFIATLTDSDAKIKWPNDLILNGKKIAGILVESRRIGKAEFLIIGIGLNILQKNFDNLPKAGSILTQTNLIFEPKNVAERLFRHLQSYLSSPEDPKKVLIKFNQHLFKRNEVAVFQINGNRQNGIIKSVGDDGLLQVELEDDGLQKFFHKEIAMLY